MVQLSYVTQQNECIPYYEFQSDSVEPHQPWHANWSEKTPSLKSTKAYEHIIVFHLKIQFIFIGFTCCPSSFIFLFRISIPFSYKYWYTTRVTQFDLHFVFRFPFIKFAFWFVSLIQHFVFVFCLMNKTLNAFKCLIWFWFSFLFFILISSNN